MNEKLSSQTESFLQVVFNNLEQIPNEEWPQLINSVKNQAIKMLVNRRDSLNSEISLYNSIIEKLDKI